MLAALSAHTGVPTDVPFEQLTARQRRVVLTAAARSGSTCRIRGRRSIRQARQEESASKTAASGVQRRVAVVPLSIQGALSGAGRSGPIVARPCAASSIHLIDEVECSTCDGTPAARRRGRGAAARVCTIGEICRLPLERLVAELARWKWTREEKKIAGELIREIQTRVQFLVDVGLEYLTLARPAPTLSGGEAQRIRLASQVGSGLCGVLYVLDEPTIGLHPRDNRRLLDGAGKTSRPGQHAAGGRARSRSGSRGRSAARFRSRRRRVRRPDRRPRHAGASGQDQRLGHRAVSVRQEGDRRADQPPHGSRPSTAAATRESRKRAAKANGREAR